MTSLVPEPRAPVLVTEADQLSQVARELARAELLAVDLESNGLFAYTAGLCTLQVLEPASGRMIVFDPMALPDEALAPLGAFLGPEGPRKIVHDIAFDARIMSQHGLALGNVFDTALAARFLGLAATGLASLALARLGVAMSKKMQQHDWGKRPFPPEALRYLAADVAVLPPLHAQLLAEVTAKSLGPELHEETRYRLFAAQHPEPDARPPYVRIRDAERLPPRAMAVLRGVAQVREDEARRLGVPPFKVLDNAVLLALAKSPPASRAELSGLRGVQHGRARALHAALWAAVEQGLRAGDVPADEREHFLTPKPKPPRAVLTAARQREQRLQAFRKAEAERRGVDPQAVLPGHVLRHLAEKGAGSIDALAQVPGLGAFRVARDGAALWAAIEGPPRSPPSEG